MDWHQRPSLPEYEKGERIEEGGGENGFGEWLEGIRGGWEVGCVCVRSRMFGGTGEGGGGWGGVCGGGGKGGGGGGLGD